ncbi:MAG: DNA-directed RNA polymerase subunit F [Candidatus Aenigmatarchaeota archaeon]
MNVLSEKDVTNVEAKEILEEREKEKELKYEQKVTLALLRKTCRFDVEKVRKIVEELKSIERLREKQIVAIANFLPEDRDELRAILQKEYTALTEEEIDKILEIVKKV